MLGTLAIFPSIPVSSHEDLNRSWKLAAGKNSEGQWMHYRTFGRTGWSVSEVGYGMWGLAGWTGSEDAESLAAL